MTLLTREFDTKLKSSTLSLLRLGLKKVLVPGVFSKLSSLDLNQPINSSESLVFLAKGSYYR